MDKRLFNTADVGYGYRITLPALSVNGEEHA